MKQSYFYTSPEGPIGLIEGDKMPVMKYWPEGTPMLTDYEKAIERAIASGTPVPNIEKAKDLIEKLRIDLGADAKVWDSYLGKEGAIYGPFTVEYRKQGVCCSPIPPNINHHGYCDECDRYTEVAILYDDTDEQWLKKAYENKSIDDDTPEKEEIQDEGMRLLEKCDITFESIRKIIVILKEAEPERLPELVRNIDIDFELIQATIRDHYKHSNSTPEKETQEDQEALWREVYWSYPISDYVIQELKEKFTITRKI